MKGGDFNVEPPEIQPWFNSLGGVLVAGQVTACRQTLLGHMRDYFGVDAGLLARARDWSW